MHGENIFEHKDAYYDPTRAAVRLEDRAGYVFGFVADFRKMKPDRAPGPPSRRRRCPRACGLGC